MLPPAAGAAARGEGATAPCAADAALAGWRADHPAGRRGGAPHPAGGSASCNALKANGGGCKRHSKLHGATERNAQLLPANHLFYLCPHLADQIPEVCNCHADGQAAGRRGQAATAPQQTVAGSTGGCGRRQARLSAAPTPLGLAPSAALEAAGRPYSGCRSLHRTLNPQLHGQAPEALLAATGCLEPVAGTLESDAGRSGCC